jgi:CheY-like chemotaxis protein
VATRALRRRTAESREFSDKSMERFVMTQGADLQRHPRTIFVVDDEELVRSVAMEILVHLGYEVQSASTGEEAVARIEAGDRPDCILLDVVMPGIGGVEALRRIRALAPDVPVVISSGFTDQVSAASLVDEGATAIISKPYRIEALDTRLREVMG